MVDIPLTLSQDGLSLDWCNPLLLAQPADSTKDLETYVLMLLSTDRSVPTGHYGIETVARRGSWHEAYVGEFGVLFWLGSEENRWNNGSKLAQLQAWAEQALQTVYDEGLIKAPAVVDVGWIDDEAVQIDVSVTAADGSNRKVAFVLPSA